MILTNIQKYSIHDGDGIRTTFFFKGCPLSCVWCHNPETQRKNPELMTDPEKCTSCGACSRVCQSGAAPGSCTDPCGRCIPVCPLDLRKVAGKSYTEEELVRIALRDQPFYENSGGGVTFSGGEVLCQNKEELVSLAKHLKREGISLYIDTCGECAREQFDAILPYADAFLYDIKCIDPALHRKYTGADNSRILDNLKYISRKGAVIDIRIPVIPGVSGSIREMTAAAEFLIGNDIHVRRIHLLPYHSTGNNKYARLGRGIPDESLRIPDPEELSAYIDIFREAGFKDVRRGG